MTITYRPLGKSYLDKSEWPELMRKFEGNIGVPYDDGKHIATTGIGGNGRQELPLMGLLHPAEQDSQ